MSLLPCSCSWVPLSTVTLEHCLVYQWHTFSQLERDILRLGHCIFHQGQTLAQLGHSLFHQKDTVSQLRHGTYHQGQTLKLGMSLHIKSSCSYPKSFSHCSNPQLSEILCTPSCSYPKLSSTNYLYPKLFAPSRSYSKHFKTLIELCQNFGTAEACRNCPTPRAGSGIESTESTIDESWNHPEPRTPPPRAAQGHQVSSPSADWPTDSPRLAPSSKQDVGVGRAGKAERAGRAGSAQMNANSLSGRLGTSRQVGPSLANRDKFGITVSLLVEVMICLWAKEFKGAHFFSTLTWHNMTK